MTYVSCYDQVLILITQPKYLLYKLVANFSYSIVVQIFPCLRFDSHLIRILREGRLDNTQNQSLLLSRLLTIDHPRISLVALLMSFTSYTWSLVQCHKVTTRLVDLVSPRTTHIQGKHSHLSYRGHTLDKIGFRVLTRTILQTCRLSLSYLDRCIFNFIRQELFKIYFRRLLF